MSGEDHRLAAAVLLQQRSVRVREAEISTAAPYHTSSPGSSGWAHSDCVKCLSNTYFLSDDILVRPLPKVPLGAGETWHSLLCERQAVGSVTPLSDAFPEPGKRSDSAPLGFDSRSVYLCFCPEAGRLVITDKSLAWSALSSWVKSKHHNSARQLGLAAASCVSNGNLT